MIKMSFMSGTLDRNTAAEVITKTDKKLYHRFGYAYKGATASEITKSKALEIVQSKGNLLDIDENETKIILNTYSSNDMW